MASPSTKRASKTFTMKHFPGLITTIFVLSLTSNLVDSSRIARAVMMSMTPAINTECTELSVTEKNLTSAVILTGTVSSCDAGRAGSYKCTLQIWRAMKGKKVISDLVREQPGYSRYKKTYVDVFGLGSSVFCNSKVEDHDTRIFFLNRANDRLILSASLLRITLANLENTQAVIEGRHIVEPVKKPRDPCLDVLCGYGARCKSIEGNASCICPSLSCGSSETETDIFAPVCGSDGITYPNECRLKGAQCMIQRRIRLVSHSACEPDCDGKDRLSEVCRLSTTTTTAPIVDTSSCRDITCGNSAVCQVKIGSDGSRTPTCECPTCDNEPTKLVCGSDQRTHRSACDMRRQACMEERKEITVVRHSPCNPCEVFNETSGHLELTCGGSCSLDEQGQPTCCDDLRCDERPPGDMCGSDGNTYQSLCAMKRRACMIARDISMVKDGPCPPKTSTTLVTGSISIQADENCPGNCDPDNARFGKFIKKLEKSVNKHLKQQNDEDIDERTLGDFQVKEVRSGSAVLVFHAYASTNSQPITMSDAGDKDTMWIYDRLYHPVSGALTEAMSREVLSPVDGRDPHDDFVVEDVCLDLVCSHGAGCSLTRSGETLTPSCSCDGIGDEDRLPVTLACKRGSSGDSTSSSSFANKDAARKEMCLSNTTILFKDVCSEPPESQCEGECQGEGQVCMVTNGKGVCECLSCGSEYKPVCTIDGQTFRSMCDLQRQNCLTGERLAKQHDGPCESQCSNVKCWNGAQCETVANGAECVCPTDCVETYAPVCGSNCVTYDNECKMVVEGCKSKQDITVAHTGTCDSQSHCRDGSGGEEEGSSMVDDECGCKYGATCGDTIDDEDANCVCAFSCPSSDSDTKVCGSDGVTYMNECELNSAQCKKQKAILVTSTGPCQVTCTGSRYGCCADGVTPAKGFRKAGCPETCQCNPSGSYGTSCSPTTGQCVCRPGVGGLKCDRCKPGFWNFRDLAEGHTSGCMACRCHNDGSRREDCDQMTGQCDCKAGVKGTKCTECQSDGSWVTASVCERTNTSASSTCENLSCRAGQDCVYDDVIDGYVCKCPDLSSCDEFNGGSVCGTNGITYPDVCQMRVMTCKQGLDVAVASEGSCQDFVPPLVETPTEGTKGTTTSKPTSTLKPSSKPDSSPEPETYPEPETHPELEPETTQPKTSPELNPSESQTSPEPEPEVQPTLEVIVHPDLETSPEPEPEMMSTRNAVPTTELKTSPEPEVTSIVLPEDEIESSGNGCLFGDDEDCMGSGDGIQTEPSKPTATTTTSSHATSSPTTSSELHITMATAKQEAVLYSGRGTFQTVDGVKLSYDTALEDSSSEIFKRYSAIIEAKIMEYVSDPSLKQQVKAFRITGFSNYSVWYKPFEAWVYADFVIHLASGSMREDVQRALNSVSNAVHDFEIKDTESSGNGCLFGDDEDCMGSGDGIQTEPSKPTATTTTSSHATSSPTTSSELHITMATAKQEAVLYSGRGTFQTVDGVKLSYDTALEDSSSEIFKRYSAIIEAKIMEYVSDPSLKQQVKAFRITGFSNYSVWYKPFEAWVYADFVIHLASGSMREDVQRALNSVSNAVHDFEIKDTDESWVVTSEEPPLVNGPKRYTEDGVWSTPQFGGASFAELLLPPALFSSTTVTITFRSTDSEGLLVFSEQEPGKTDFLSLSVNRGRAEFRFNTGSGPLILKSKTFVNDSKWHTLVARRNRREGMLKLDDRPAIHGTSPRGTSGLNVDKNLFIGGFDPVILDSVRDKVEVTKGLTGCIRSISVQDRDLIFDSTCSNCTNSDRLAGCGSSPCYPNPCRNAANCFITKQADGFTNKCDCKAGFTGKTCEQKLTNRLNDPCSGHGCHPASTCIPDSGGDGYNCQCPSGLSGVLCRDNTTEDLKAASFMPSFAQDSYLELKPLKGVRDGMNIEVTFYSSLPNGLLFYNAQRRSGKGDFVALNILESHLEFLYDLGNGLAKIRSTTAITLDKWHVAVVSRNMRMGSIAVDGGMPDTGKSPKRTWELNVKRPLYLGGVPDPRKVPGTSGITTGLTGAIQKFVVDGTPLDISKEPPNKSYNVRPFNAHVCYHAPCKNEGICHPSLGEYSCTCIEGWFGEHCTEERPAGKDIQKEEPDSGAYFDGSTKAMYKNYIKPSQSRSMYHNSYQLLITTPNQHGLLLVVGKATSSGSMLHDYLALAVSRGRIHLCYNLGSGPAHLVSKERVDDGRLATIKVERKGKVATLQVNNGLVQRVESPGKTTRLNTDGYMWIGGIDYKPHGVGLYKSFFEPFIGCVSQLSIHEEPIKLLDDALNTPTLRTCS